MLAYINRLAPSAWCPEILWCRGLHIVLGACGARSSVAPGIKSMTPGGEHHRFALEH